MSVIRMSGLGCTALRGILMLVAACAAGHAADAFNDVDTMIGTGGDGHTFPGATVPFGMIQLSPDTAMPDFKHAYKWAAGYRYEDHSILGFSETHFSGSGHSDLGDVLLMSMIRDVKATVLARLDQFIFTEDVQLGDVSDTFAATAVVGPAAARAISGVVAATPATMSPSKRTVSRANSRRSLTIPP